MNQIKRADANFLEGFRLQPCGSSDGVPFWYSHGFIFTSGNQSRHDLFGSVWCIGMNSSWYTGNDGFHCLRCRTSQFQTAHRHPLRPSERSITTEDLAWSSLAGFWGVLCCIRCHLPDSGVFLWPLPLNNVKAHRMTMRNL